MAEKRQVNFELLRILCMYMIVIGHCLFHGRVTAKLGYGTVNYFLSYFIQSFSVVHVNCFIMLAGYFSIDRQFKSQRLLKLWKQVLFYSLGIFLIWSVFDNTGWEDVIMAIFPLSTKNYWFASVYMGVSFLMPFAGMLAIRLTKRQYQYLLVVLAVLLSVNHMIFRVNTYGVYTGREVSWFLFLIFLAGYIKLYTKAERRYFWYGIGGYAVCSLTVLGSVYLAMELKLEDMGYFLNYNSFLSLLATVFLFLGVKNMPWKKSKLDGLILRISGAAFGVYLIHDNYLIRYHVWDLFRTSKVALTHWSVIYAAAVAMVVYIVCTCLDLVRQKIFTLLSGWYKKTGWHQKEEKLCDKIDNIFVKEKQ